MWNINELIEWTYQCLSLNVDRGKVEGLLLLRVSAQLEVAS